MNERIKELYKQAGLTMNNPLAYEQWYLDSLEKFAELIVGECAKIARATPCPYTDETMRQQLGHTWDMACIESAKDIEEHFGIEE